MIMTAKAFPVEPYMAGNAASSGMIGTGQVPSWEEQIVPTLRKRLESESAYLSRRLSSGNFRDVQPETSASRPSTSRQPSQQRQDFHQTTVQTTQASGSASHARPERPSASRQNSSFERSSPASKTAVVGSPSASTKSRIPSRQRSRSTLVPRVSPTHEIAPPLPLPNHSQSSFHSTGRPTPPRNASSYGSGRHSPDIELDVQRTKEGFIKNELPPFRLVPDEALRIAERGHDLEDAVREPIQTGGNGEERYQMEDEEEGNKRKRAVTMRTTSPEASGRRRSLLAEQLGDSDSNRSRRNSLRPSTGSTKVVMGISNIPRSSTGSVGLGHPSSRNLANTSGSRSSSSRQASIKPSPTSSGTAPRSASLNLLHSPSSNTPSRLGIAAHLVPPENKYTPPKGANWDEVVLPTVAKRLGIGEEENDRDGSGDEGDLAVEWDKHGTPIKWIKGAAVRRVGGDPKRLTENANITQEDYIFRTHPPSPLPTPSAATSSFKPSFDPSPDNPMYSNPSPSHLRPQPPAGRSSPSPTPRHQRSVEKIELGPIRTSSSRAPSLHTRVSNRDLREQRSNPHLGGSSQGERERPSYLRTPQASFSSRHAAPFQQYAQAQAQAPAQAQAHNHDQGETGAPTRQAFQNPRPAPSRGHFGAIPTPAATQAEVSRRQTSGTGGLGVSVVPGAGPSGQGLAHQRKKDDEHEKGCGCIIM